MGMTPSADQLLWSQHDGFIAFILNEVMFIRSATYSSQAQ